MEIVSTGQWLPGDANALSIEGKAHGAKVTVLAKGFGASAGWPSSSCSVPGATL